LATKDSTKTDEENNSQIYHFCRVPFVIISSTFLLVVTINFHLQQSDLSIAVKVQRDINTHNVITGVDTLSETKLQQPL